MKDHPVGLEWDRIVAIKSIQSYEGRMGVFDWGIIVIALIALMILIVCLFSTWMAFEKSLGLTF